MKINFECLKIEFFVNLLHCEVEKGSGRVDESHCDGVSHELEHVGEQLLGSLDALLEQSAFAPGQGVQRVHEVHSRGPP